MKLTRDIQSLSTFKRDTAKLVRQMKKTGQPVVLTVNGKAELVVQDAASYLPQRAKDMVRGSFFQALPQRDNTDGFFAARLKKAVR